MRDRAEFDGEGSHGEVRSTPGWAWRAKCESVESRDMKNLFNRFVREEEGQDIIEYSLLAAFISISGYLILQSIGTNVNTIYTKVQTATTAASS